MLKILIENGLNLKAFHCLLTEVKTKFKLFFFIIFLLLNIQLGVSEGINYWGGVYINLMVVFFIGI